ncbi:MAG: ABC transporter substrate-binding protein [Anaerolineales bacterium]|nr:ABC transporter substrate-binding protein [Anaerolineales bacterium]
MNRVRMIQIGALTLLVLLAACAAPAPQVVEKTVVVEKPVERIVEKTVVAERTVVVQPTAVPGRDTLVVALARAPSGIDPADHSSREAETVIRNLYDGLVTRDKTSGVHMEIAESIKWLDTKTLEIKLRKGVKFHDGSELKADDVVFTFDRVFKPNAIEYPQPHNALRKGFLGPYSSAVKKDDYTVTVNFTAPWPAAMQMLVHTQMVSKAYVTKVGTKGLIEKPLGTGPFKFVSTKTGLEEVVLERFADYFGGAPTLAPVGKACVSRAVFRVIPENSTRVAALLAGEVDIITEVPAELVDTLKKVPGVQVKTVPGTRPIWMELNVMQSPFDDPKVRQALNYAVDKNLIIKKVYNSLAQPLGGALMPTNNFADPSLKPYAYDKAKASALLKEAGWTPDASGMLMKDGKPLAFVIDTIDSLRPVTEAVATMLRDVGIDASVRVWEYNVVRPKLLARERQAYVGDWGDSAFDPVGHMEAKWHSLVTGSTYGRGNFSGYANKRVDELIKAGETENDPAKRKAIYYEAQKLIYDEAPALFLVLPEAIEAAAARVTNWSPASDSRENLHDVCLK